MSNPKQFGMKIFEHKGDIFFVLSEPVDRFWYERAAAIEFAQQILKVAGYEDTKGAKH